MKEILGYEIDRKLKIGRDYPPDLLTLIDLFYHRLPLFGIRKPISRQKLEERYRLLGHEEMEKIPRERRKDYVAEIQKRFDTGPSRPAQRQYEKEISLIEKTFKDFFLVRSRMAEVEIANNEKYQRSLGKFREEWSRTLWAKKDPSKIVHLCLKRTNRKVKLFHPLLSPAPSEEGKPRRYSLDHSLRSEDFRLRKDLGNVHIYWISLANTMAQLNPMLVHKCRYCRKIFISRQRKDYCGRECSIKFLSEKVIKSGKAKEYQRSYRRRLKQKPNIR